MTDSPWHTLDPDRRIMAHNIEWQGRVHTMHIASLTPAGQIRLTPYDGEDWGITFINGSITLRTTSSGWQYRALPSD